MTIKNKLNKDAAMSTAKLFMEQYQQKGLMADVDLNTCSNPKLTKDIQAINDKLLPGYDCDELPKNNFFQVWGNVWKQGLTDENKQSEDRQTETPSVGM